MNIQRAKLSHKNKVSDAIERFSNVTITGYEHDEVQIYNCKSLDYKNCNCKRYNGNNYDYDTYIWTKEILNSSDVELWKRAVIREMKNGKNIYNMARLYRIEDYYKLKKYAEKYEIKFFDCSNPNKFEELRKYAEIGLDGINSKVITVMGTGRQSGKFTTSMILKEKLEKCFKIGTVGTEPQSKLCGVDEMVVPQLIPSCHVSSTIFGAIKKVDLKNKNLIIVSSQTGIFSNPLEIGTGRGGGVISLSILLGSKPDYVLLASNTLDIATIKKNIKAIELLSGSKVIGLTINDKNLNLSLDFDTISKNISSKLNIPVANVITGFNLDVLIDYIVDVLNV